MKRFLWLALLTLAPWAGWSSTAQAQGSSQPVVVMSLSGFDQIKDGLKGQFEMMGMAKEFKQVDAMANALSTGLDRSKPIGLAVTLGGEMPTVVGFVPVSNLDQLLGGLALFQIPVEDVGGMKKVKDVYIKEQDGYAFLGQKPEDLQTLPDPAKSLGDLPKQYDMAMAINVQNVPADQRELAMGLIRQGMEASLQKNEEESDAQFELRKKLAEQQVKAFDQIFSECDQVVMGLTMDRTAKQLAMDMRITAKRGTKMADQFAQLKNASSKFGGVVRPDALVGMNVASMMTDQSEIDQVVSQLQAYKSSVMQMIEDSKDFDSDEERTIIKGWASQALDILQKTVETGRLDMAVSAVRTPAGPLSVLGGVHIADGKALEGLVQQVLKMAEKQTPNMPKIEFNVATHKGANIHGVAIPAPENDPEGFAKVFGDKPMFYVGFSPDTAWTAMGTGSLDTLKAAIDASAQSRPVPPMELTFSVGSIMQMAAEMDANNPALLPLATAVQPGKDHVRMLVEPIENGERVRFLIEDEVLKLIGMAVQMQKQLQGPPPEAPPFN